MNNSLLSLLHLSDPTLPIGGYAHSAGLETYVQKGLVNSKEIAREFVTQMLSRNLQYTDAAFVSFAQDASIENNYAAIIQLDETCSAVKLLKEMRMASQKLGIRLIKIFQPVCENDLANQYQQSIGAA